MSTEPRDPRRAFKVVDDFEDELCWYTGAPYAVATDSCTNALFLALLHVRLVGETQLRIKRQDLAAEARALLDVADEERRLLTERERVRFARLAGEVESLHQRERTGKPPVTLPRRTYVGVLQAALNAGFQVTWSESGWSKSYQLDPTPVVDAALDFRRGMYDRFDLDGGRGLVYGSLVCVSFHPAKQLPIGRGGAVLTADAAAADWLRAARNDGRLAGQAAAAMKPGFHCGMAPPDAALGLWILSRFPDEPLPARHDAYPDLAELGLA